ncbi:hypothetical protein JKP88DRAFT_179983 [Tribonema minus]|uniref:Uncharacterized protein n=1 Tax=Tribonema minus TaxID=303371 RepID=A0A835Z473_9STRA|nr:hypothetical protein JKP88DRAFT_179983 [Tribonema minus]
MHPETSEEAALRAGLQAEIKAESKAVIKLADDQRIDLEWPEAMEIAKEQVLKRRMDEERRQVKKEMEAAAKALEIEEAAAEAERKTRRLAAMNALSEGAASKIQRVYAQYRAREYVRRLAMATYEKHFDVASGAYWWSNPLIKTVSWAKPPLLGAYDVDPPDEWAVMPGAYDLVYYYNPRTFAMVGVDAEQRCQPDLNDDHCRLAERMSYSTCKFLVCAHMCTMQFSKRGVAIAQCQKAVCVQFTRVLAVRCLMTSGSLSCDIHGGN